MSLLVLSYKGLAKALVSGRITLADLEAPGTLFVFQESENVLLGALGSDLNAFHNALGFTDQARDLDTRFKQALLRADADGRALYGIGRYRDWFKRRNEFLAQHGCQPLVQKPRTKAYRGLPRVIRGANPHMTVISKRVFQAVA